MRAQEALSRLLLFYDDELFYQNTNYSALYTPSPHIKEAPVKGSR